MSLARLSPFGPIFAKELRTTARRKRTYWLRSVYLLTLFLFLLLAYTSTSARSYQVTSVAQQAREEAELGTVFFATFAIFSAFAMPLIAPILTATSLSAERLGRTLNVLLMTPLSSWQIVTGKLFSRLLIALTLLALSLPVLAVVRLLGGVDLDAMVEVLCICAATALAAAALGLFLSSFINRTYAVVLLAYLTMGFAYLFVPMMLALTMAASNNRRGPPLWFFEFLNVTNPIFHVMARVTRGMPRGLSRGGWEWCIVFHLGVAALFVWATGIMLRRFVRRQGDAGAPAHAEIVALATPPPVPLQASALVESLNPQKKHRARKLREVGDNPILWRELRRPLFTKRWQAIVGAVLVIALLGVTYIALANQWTNQLTDPDTHAGYAVIFCGLIGLLICVVSGTAIATEKESDTWTLLIATPMTSRSIIYGKAGGLLRRIMWPMIFVAAHFLIFTVTGVLSWTSFFGVLWVIITFNSIWLATGLYFSLRFKNNTFSVVANLLTPVAAYILVPVLMLILGNLVLDQRAERIMEWTQYYDPFMYVAHVVRGMPANEHWRWDSSTNRLWLPYETDPSPRQFMSTIFIVGLLSVGITFALLELMVQRFNAIVGRASTRPQRLIMAPGSTAVAGVT